MPSLLPCRRWPHVMAGAKAPALAACLTACLAWAPSSTMALPFVPTDDDQVVQRLPMALGADTRAARRALAARPTSLPLALDVARAALGRSRRDGDPRELGVAQAALAPWWALAAPPAAVRLVRATVLQARHDFDAALQDLAAVAEAPSGAMPGGGVGLGSTDDRQPSPAVRAQAQLTRAAVLRAVGRWDEAAEACRRLAGPPLAQAVPAALPYAQACLAELRSLTGDGAQADAALAGLARRAAHEPWFDLLRAELAQRRGDTALAVSLLRRAAGEADEVYHRAALADAWLEHGRPDEVLALLGRGELDADALLLRRAIALRRLGDAQADADAAVLAARFEAARQRGERFHQREEAMLALDVRGDAATALARARDNFRHQREPLDVLLLARAAAAAGDEAAAQPVRDLLAQGWRDRRVDAALATWSVTGAKP